MRDQYIDVVQISTDSPILSVCVRRVCVPPQSWLAYIHWLLREKIPQGRAELRRNNNRARADRYAA